MQTAPGTSLNGVDEVSGSAVPQTPGAATGAGRHPGAPDRPRRIALLVGVAVFVIAADVISKSIVVAKMADHPPIRLLGGLLTITLTRNGGAAFSIGTSMTIVFTAIALGVIVYILRAARNLRSIGWAIALGLLLGGATGNLLDRIFRAPAAFQGHVVDWIELPHWPVFNLADSSICCAGVLVVLLALRGIRLDGTKAVPPDDPAPQATAAEPQAVEPRAAEPGAAERGAVESRAAERGAAEPRAVEPRAVESRAAEPRAVEPRAVESRAAEPRAAAPRAAESQAADDGR